MMPLSVAAAGGPRPVLVAVPVKDEAERIGVCLAGLAAQNRLPDRVVLLLNNCRDATFEVVQRLVPKLPFPVDCVVRKLPAEFASAGHARRLAMALAAEHARQNGVLLTTDADAVPPPDWISRNLAALAQGADLVCGRAVMDWRELRLMPDRVRRDGTLERELSSLLDSIAWVLDPEPHDPMPRHTEASGASLAMSVTAFHAAGGLAPVACGEDRALARAMWARDLRVRHDPWISVTVSARITGRAAGGMADTLRRRLIRQDMFADDALEPVEDAWRRYALRRRVRVRWAGGQDPRLAADLGVTPDVLSSALREPFFGAAWQALEGTSRLLARRPVRFADLHAEIAAARSLLPPDAMAAD